MNKVSVDFRCTQCAKCCHDLRLPLTVSEALIWLARGGTVEVLCEVLPWPEEDAANAEVMQKRARTFGAFSGALPVRIGVILAASYPGACPNLLSSGRCGIYEERPLVCRIYPAEVNPFLRFDKTKKACPEEAWTRDAAPMLRHGRIVDEALARDISVRRQRDVDDVPTKERLCQLLGIHAGAVWNEGFLAYKPGSNALSEALMLALAGAALSESESESESAPGDWTFVSHRVETVDALNSVRARAADRFDAGEQAAYLPLS